jgi:chromosome condensin MukBEF ATPase and DNA-binding subunit MukB
VTAETQKQDSTEAIIADLSAALDRVSEEKAELLEALEALEAAQTGTEINDAWDMAQAALQKARGQ